MIQQFVLEYFGTAGYKDAGDLFMTLIAVVLYVFGVYALGACLVKFCKWMLDL